MVRSCRREARCEGALFLQTCPPQGFPFTTLRGIGFSSIVSYPPITHQSRSQLIPKRIKKSCGFALRTIGARGHSQIHLAAGHARCRQIWLGISLKQTGRSRPKGPPIVPARPGSRVLPATSSTTLWGRVWERVETLKMSLRDTWGEAARKHAVECVQATLQFA